MSQKWNEDITAQLVTLVGKETPVSNKTVDDVAEALGEAYTANSVAAKLRKMDYEVASRAKSATKTFTDAEAERLSKFVKTNAGKYTYAEIATAFEGGKFTTKQVQGKLLSMELTGSVKPTEKVEIVHKYNAEEEATLLDMVRAGDFVEDIAEALGKTIQSVRGKVLSLLNTNEGLEMPKQKQSYAKDTTDGLEALGDVSEMTIAEIATALEKTERGVKVMLTHRGIDCANHKGAAKREKIDAKKAAA